MAVPLNVPVGNRNVAGDFHRPYEGRVPFDVPPGNSDVAGDFHRPYERRVPFIGEKRGRCGCTDPAGCVREG